MSTLSLIRMYTLLANELSGEQYFKFYSVLSLFLFMQISLYRSTLSLNKNALSHVARK